MSCKPNPCLGLMAAEKILKEMRCPGVALWEVKCSRTPLRQPIMVSALEEEEISGKSSTIAPRMADPHSGVKSHLI